MSRTRSRHDITLTDLVDAVKANNASAGGSVLPRGSMSFVIRGGGAVQAVRQIESVFVKSAGGAPASIKNVAAAALDSPQPSGISSKDRTDDSVAGICLMRRGENPYQSWNHSPGSTR